MDLCDPLEILQAHQLRKTPQRISVLQELIRKSGLLKASEIHNKLSRSMSIDLVTVYRILGQFTGAGIARKFIDDGIDLYELACLHHPVHPHFKCATCGELSCLPAMSVKDQTAVARYADGYRFNEIRLTFGGTCPVCAGKG